MIKRAMVAVAAIGCAAAVLAPAAHAREFWIALDGVDEAEYTEEDPGTYAGLWRQFQWHAPRRKASFKKGYDTLVLKDGAYCLPSPPPDAKGGYRSPWAFNWDGRCLLIRSASGDPGKCYFQVPKGESYHCPLQFNTSPHVKEPQFKLKGIGFRGFSGPASYPFQSGPPCVELENCELQDADGTTASSRWSSRASRSTSGSTT